jgi:hypothetical protein
MSPMKVLLVELNEITWKVIDQLIAERGEGFLPNFAMLRREGAWCVQRAIEVSPHLDPWVTWVTAHTGVEQSVHGATVLEQEATTLGARRTWHYAAEAGLSVGVFGSISAYPPSPLDAFVVPGPFAPGNETYPPSLSVIQDINRTYTQAHNKTRAAPSVRNMLAQGVAGFRHGLRPSTVLRIGKSLVRERLDPGTRWQRAALQPLLNFDVFAHLYRKHRPDFATWHSNHAAHFMHHYWRAWDDSAFQAKATPEERRRYGSAVPLGYALCDELIGRFRRLIDDRTVLVIASSMGQKPFVKDLYPEGKIVVRVRSIDRLLEVLGARDVERRDPTMVPQWNLLVPVESSRSTLKRLVSQAYRELAGKREAAFSVTETGAILTVTPIGLATRDDALRYRFPGAPGDRDAGFSFDELFVADTPTVKQGMHDPDGLLAFFGRGVRRGARLPECTNLDVAPTLLSLMGVPRPPALQGRAIDVLDTADTLAPELARQRQAA